MAEHKNSRWRLHKWRLQWLTWQTALLQSLKTLPTPVVHRHRTSIASVAVAWVAPVQTRASKAATQFQVQAYATPVLSHITQTKAYPIGIPSKSRHLPLGKNISLAAYSTRLDWHPKVSAVFKTSLHTTAQQAALDCATPKQKTLRWQPVAIPCGKKLPMEKALNPQATSITVAMAFPASQNHTNTAKTWPLERLPIPAHRFAMQERQRFREALAEKGNITDASQVLLRSVVDRVPINRIQEVAATNDGGVTYKVVSGENTGLQHVVTGRHLQTRQNIITQV